MTELFYCKESPVAESNTCMDDFEFALAQGVKTDELFTERHKWGLNRTDLLDKCWKRLTNGPGVLPKEVNEDRYVSCVRGKGDLKAITLFSTEMNIGCLQERISSPVKSLKILG